MNLLALIRLGEISAAEAEDIFDETIAARHRGESPADWVQTLEFDNYEATAYGQGASLAALAKARYEGWPTNCWRCGRPLDYRLWGWWF